MLEKPLSLPEDLSVLKMESSGYSETCSGFQRFAWCYSRGRSVKVAVWEDSSLSLLRGVL